jgi:inner membrane protein
MFNSTHTFVGFAIARMGAEKWVRHGTVTAVIAANLPDIDSVAGFWGTPAYLDHHRGVTHSLIGVPILAIALSAVMFLFTRNFWRTYAVALVAVATHPALDYLNPYGLRPFLPWNGTWFYGDLVFIFDPVLDVVLMTGLLAGWLLPRRKHALALASLAAALIYVGVRLQLHSMAEANLQHVARQVTGVTKTVVLPEIWSPLEWEGIVDTTAGLLRLPVHAFRPPAVSMDEFPRLQSSGPPHVIAHAARSESAAAFLRFARFPVIQVEPLASGYGVTFIDFRFYRGINGTALGAEVVLDSSLNVQKESLSFLQRVSPGSVPPL